MTALIWFFALSGGALMLGAIVAYCAETDLPDRDLPSGQPMFRGVRIVITKHEKQERREESYARGQLVVFPSTGSTASTSRR